MIAVTRISAIPIGNRYRAAIGKLRDLDFDKAGAAVQRALQRASFPVVFGGLDISLNEDMRKRWAPYWQLHLYAVVVGATSSEVRDHLARLYPADERAPRPLLVNECQHLAEAISYIIKPYFSRRVSYVRKTGRQHNWTCRLRNHELRELARFLCRYDLKDRYILIGCRRSKKGIKLNSSAKDKLFSRREIS